MVLLALSRRARASRRRLHHHADRLFRGRRGLRGGQVPDRDGSPSARWSPIVCFRSWPRRLAFLAAAIAGPDPRQRRPRLGDDLRRPADRQHRVRRRASIMSSTADLLRHRHRADPRRSAGASSTAASTTPGSIRERCSRGAARRAAASRSSAASLALAALPLALVERRSRRRRRSPLPAEIALPDVPAGSASPPRRAAPGSRISPAPTASASPAIATRRAGRSISPSPSSPARGGPRAGRLRPGRGRARRALGLDRRRAGAAGRTGGTDRLARGGTREVVELLPCRRHR